MRIIAVVNQKGGSGKTTTAVNLAASLAESAKKVLLIDLDPQASASLWYGYKDQGRGLFELFTENKVLKDIIQKTNVDLLDIIPSSPLLAGIEKALSNEIGVENTLKERILAHDRAWDFVLIDCPPNLSLLSLSALTAASEVLIPVETHVMALHGLVQLLNTIKVVQQRLNPTLQISGIVPCRVDMRTKHAKDVIAQLKTRFKDQVFDSHIRENIKLAEAPLFRKNILHYDSKCNGAIDYRALAKELVKRK